MNRPDRRALAGRVLPHLRNRAVHPIPIPFSHNPLAIALSIVALGFVERDGYVIIGGAIGALGGIVINISLTGGALLLGLKLLHLV